MAANKQAGIYTTYASWKRALRNRWPCYKIEGNIDIAQAYLEVTDLGAMNGARQFVGEWDGAEGTVKNSATFPKEK